MKDSWLRTFFMNAKEKLELSCNTTILDQCCLLFLTKQAVNTYKS